MRYLTLIVVSLLMLFLQFGCAGQEESALKDCVSGYGVGGSETVLETECGIHDESASAKLAEQDEIDTEINDIISGKQESAIGLDPLNRTLVDFYSNR